MNKESLKKARTLIVNAIYNSNINAQDKAELMMNIIKFLNNECYDKNIKILNKVRYKK